MTNIAEIQTQIDQEQARLRKIEVEAAEAERIRVEAATAPARQMEAARREIERLQEQKELVSWQGYADAYYAALKSFDDNKTQLLELLNNGKVLEARELVRAINGSLEAATHAKGSADQVIAELRRQKFQALKQNAAAAGVTGFGFRMGSADEIAASQHANAQLDAQYGRYTLPDAPNILSSLTKWVEAAPEGFDRQYRRGIAYAFCGRFCDGFDALLMQFTNVPTY